VRSASSISLLHAVLLVPGYLHEFQNSLLAMSGTLVSLFIPTACIISGGWLSSGVHYALWCKAPSH